MIYLYGSPCRKKFNKFHVISFVYDMKIVKIRNKVWKVKKNIILKSRAREERERRWKNILFCRKIYCLNFSSLEINIMKFLWKTPEILFVLFTLLVDAFFHSMSSSSTSSYISDELHQAWRVCHTALARNF